MDSDDDLGRDLVVRAERALDDLEASGGASGPAGEAVEALVDLYGTVLDRVMAHVTDAPPGELHAALVRDELVGHVLMAHGLVPAPPELDAVGSAGSVSTEVPVALGRRPSSNGGT